MELIKDDYFGKEVVIKEDVVFLGDPKDDPKNDPAFQIVHNALLRVYGKKEVSHVQNVTP